MKKSDLPGYKQGYPQGGDFIDVLKLLKRLEKNYLNSVRAVFS